MRFTTLSHPSPLKIGVILAIFSILVTLTTTQNINYAPPPAVNFTLLLKLNQSTQESVFIGQKRLQSLEISQATGTTTFKLSYFNRSQDNDMTQYTISEAGTWTYVKGTAQTLSCNLIYETTNSTLGLLLFDSQNNIFKILGKIPLGGLLALLPSPYNTSGQQALAAGFSPGQNCKAGLLFGSVYQFISDSSVNSIILPAGWTVSAYTESFKYGITNGKLYKLNDTTSQYDPIYTFDTFAAYTIKEYQGRMIITGANGTNNAAGYNTFIQKIYVLNDRDAGLQEIKVITLNGSYQSQLNIPVLTSPQLTKMVYFYIPAGTAATPQLFPKSIDYTSGQVIDMLFDDPTHAYQTLSTIVTNSFDFSDYFFVIRNGSSNNRVGAVEQAYQFMGNKVVLFASRALTTNMELFDWVRVKVDLYYTDTCVALDVYNTPGGKLLYEAQFGSYAETKRIIPTETPPFIKFEQPTYTFKQSVNPENFTWGYYDASAGTSTNVTIFRVNPFGANHYDVYNQNPTGNFRLVVKSASCRLLYEAFTQQYVLFKYDSAAGQVTTHYSLASNLAGLNPLITDAWRVSDNCDKFSFRNRVFKLSNSAYAAVGNDFNNFNWTFVDADMNYLLISGDLWKYVDSQTKYVQYTTNAGINANAVIYSFTGKVFVIAINGTSAATPVDTQILAYIDQNSQLTRVFNYRKTFTTLPNYDVSQILTKVVIYARKGTTQVVDAFYIDYSQRTNTTINFPTQTIRDFDKTLIKIFEKHLYVRQIFDTSKSGNATYTSINQQHFAYLLTQNYLPQLLMQKNLTNAEAAVWVQSLIVTDDGKDYHVATESLQTIGGKNYVIVRLIELDELQAQLNNGNNQAISGYVVNGSIVLCTPGCADCSTQACTGCKTGWTFRTNSALCLPCPPGCLACNANDPSNCSSCLDGTYLLGSSCLPCSNICITCSGSATSCLTCSPGQFYSSGAGQCMLCPRNCMTCTSSSSCTVCNKGFVVAPSGSCRGCAITCSDCLASDITQCTACGKGLQLVGLQCVQCPDNCLVCNNGKCQTCIPGYSANNLGVCVLNCRMPCATCVDNQPTVCLSCFGSSSVSNNTCIANSTCNATYTCTNCPQGLNLYLQGGVCYPCSLIKTIPNCIQCSLTNQQNCAICKDGFFLASNGSCPACPNSCVACVGSNICNACQTGYTLPGDQDKGPCLQCLSPCATCSGTPKYCTSCITGFTKQGWKCQNNTRIAFNIIFNTASYLTVVGSLDTIIAQLLTFMGENSTNVDAITVQAFTTGSVTLVASASPSAGVAAGSTGLASGLASSQNLGGVPLTSSSVTVVTPSDQKSSTNVPLIVGLTVGLASLAVIVVVITFLVCKKKHRKGSEVADSTLVVELPMEKHHQIEQVQVVALEKQFSVGGVSEDHFKK